MMTGELADLFTPYVSNASQAHQMQQKGQTPLEIFNQNQQLKPDKAQQGTMSVLDDIYHDIIKSSNKATIKGLYLYGTPGAGKTMMMDIFFNALPPNIQKMNIHFHEFMLQTHRALSHLRKNNDAANPLQIIAKAIKDVAKIICFDEFHVTDVADAMILKNLFQALFDHNIILIATSNFAPQQLYEGGIQRDQFLPFIDLLQTKCHIVHITAQYDYRQDDYRQTSDENKTPLWHLNTENGRRDFKLLFQQYSNDKAQQPPEIKFTDGRILKFHAQYPKIMLADFNQLCDTPLAAQDYLYLTEIFDIFFLINIPQLHQEDRNALKRFILLIDVLYSRKKHLICLAQTDIEAIYDGASHKDEVTRTISRLMEMENEKWKMQQ